MHGFPRRSELAQQSAEPFFDQPVGRHSALAAQAATHRPQCQEALVWSALSVALPNLEPLEEIA